MNPIVLAPTSLSTSPPLEYVEAAARAGYDGIGIRLFRSPGITYAFHPVAGNATLMRDVKSAIAASGMAVYDLQPDGALRGVWMLGDGTKSGTETLTPAK